jgi:hypothetical protein
MRFGFRFLLLLSLARYIKLKSPRRSYLTAESGVRLRRWLRNEIFSALLEGPYNPVRRKEDKQERRVMFAEMENRPIVTFETSTSRSFHRRRIPPLVPIAGL